MLRAVLGKSVSYTPASAGYTASIVQSCSSHTKCGHTNSLSFGMFRVSPTWSMYAHWYYGRSKRFRFHRDKRFHPKYDVRVYGYTKHSKRLHYKTNRWNYIQAYKDTP